MSQNRHFPSTLGLNDPSRTYEIFAEKYISIYDRYFPLKKMKAERFKFRKPWFTKGLTKSVKKKNMLYKRFLNNPSSFNENAYVIQKQTYPFSPGC